MAAGDTHVQSAVHSLDQGRFAFFIKVGMISMLIIALTLLYLFVHFRGLDNSSAMDQAQIARNIAAGKGFSTGYIRPLALGVIQGRPGSEETVDVDRFPDFYQSPLNPWVNSWPLRLIKSEWKMKASEIIYAGDRTIAIVSTVFFLLSVGVWFFVVRRLFDEKLAIYTCAAVLLTDLMWAFSLSGLPQMLMLFLFSLACLATVLAMEAQSSERPSLTIGWLVAAGAILGLMTLAHGLAFWLFLGWLFFSAIYFQPRGIAALAALAAFALLVTPWMVRNYQVCGNPFGLAVYGAFYGVSPEISYLREPSIKLSGSGTSLQGKARATILNQVGNIAPFLGLNVVAGAFFFALLHPFRSRKTSMFKWCIAAMWVSVVLGMAFYQASGAVSENQLYVLFIPLFVAYGMAFLLVLWNRLELGAPILRIAFISFLLFLCAIPMLLRIFGGAGHRLQWPPYVPPVIGALGDWFTEDEIIASDMPWAVAWYAGRNSLLLPTSVNEFNRLHDYRVTSQPICGLYLTPVSGNSPLFSGIYNGAYKEWARLITRPPETKGFPFTAVTPLPIGGECIIFADRPRWNERKEPES